jgi:hypothetical protein
MVNFLGAEEDSVHTQRRLFGFLRNIDIYLQWLTLGITRERQELCSFRARYCVGQQSFLGEVCQQETECCTCRVSLLDRKLKGSLQPQFRNFLGAEEDSVHTQRRLFGFLRNIDIYLQWLTLTHKRLASV